MELSGQKGPISVGFLPPRGGESDRGRGPVASAALLASSLSATPDAMTMRLSLGELCPRSSLIALLRIEAISGSASVGPSTAVAYSPREELIAFLDRRELSVLGTLAARQDKLLVEGDQVRIADGTRREYQALLSESKAALATS